MRMAVVGAGNGPWARLEGGFVDFYIREEDDFRESGDVWFAYSIVKKEPWEGQGFAWELVDIDGNTVAEGEAEHAELALWEVQCAALAAVGVGAATAMTPVQAAVAHKLARAYGHHWAQVVSPDVLSIRAIARKAIPAQDPDLPGGIVFPWLNPHLGVVEHTTGTGRLKWVIHPTGVVWFEIHRPLGAVLEARVNPAEVDIWVKRVNQEIPIHERHVRALVDAVRVLVPGWEPDLGAIGEVLPDEDYVEAYEEDEE